MPLFSRVEEAGSIFVGRIRVSSSILVVGRRTKATPINDDDDDDGDNDEVAPSPVTVSCLE